MSQQNNFSKITTNKYSSSVGKATSPQKILGFEIPTIITSFIVPILVAILGAALSAWFTKKIRDKLQVKVVSNLGSEQFQQLSSLYCDRVQDYERVPPHHFKAFFNREHSAKSLREFRKRTFKADVPVHLLLVAKSSDKICGFIKSIYLPDTHCLFIAYLVTSSTASHEDRTVSQKLLSALCTACNGSKVNSIVYEICADLNSRHEPKARLFRHYASALGIKLRRIDAAYQQPEICTFEAGDCKLTNAELYIAYLTAESLEDNNTIARAEYAKLVTSIYKYVYLMSYTIAEPLLADKYKDFLLRVGKNIFSNITIQTIDLK